MMTKLVLRRYIVVVILILMTVVSASALTISSTSDVSVYTRDGSAWTALNQGQIASFSSDIPLPMKMNLTYDSNELSIIMQVVPVEPGMKLIVEANYTGHYVDVVTSKSGYVQGYYGYGKSSIIPWEVYWCVYSTESNPVIVYTTFSTRTTKYGNITHSNLSDIITTQIAQNTLPDILAIQKAAGA